MGCSKKLIDSRIIAGKFSLLPRLPGVMTIVTSTDPFSCPSSLAVMVRQHIPKKYKEITLNMSLNHRVSAWLICEYTGICPWTLQQLRATYKETGKVVQFPVCDGQLWSLDSLDAKVRDCS